VAKQPKGRTTKAAGEADPAGAAGRIDERIRTLGGWRADVLAEVRRLIHEADPDVVEEVKWVKPSNPLGVPVWSHAGIVCTGEAYQEAVKLTFARGAAVSDPHGLFNAGLGGNARRAIDLREGGALDAEAFKDLIRDAVAVNVRAAARA
jgi:hypothetical protein